MHILAGPYAFARRVLETVTAFVLKIKSKIPGYRHTVIAVTTLVVAAVGDIAGEESDIYKLIVALAGALGILVVRNRPDPVKRGRRK